ncbi:acyl-CoA oxidase [Metschnikowia bicuspidata var. bicuspidata NRRL YB-4993]|uniref:Acyl-coenzyme A oxidase n=1 Tax=Metschnikowia bicuspidata var. bicuspidata NRRL YB-4993 TaxID=869754 RepID=A0A1A0H6R6_9ASCO|nr:acyl-CoA oxidase [Metschnikowia bicuspidata var. bicuspidata NRRL YB-4993]OBA19721.1 acyl-CoA oxidase [Metschnikowia bicuspidata var. bicuspidata NRRL YB-4993]
MPITGRSLVSTLPGPTPAALMIEERAKAMFDPSDMLNVVEGTAKKANKIMELYQSLERDPLLAPGYADYELSRAENREQTTARIARMTQYVELESYADFWRRLNLVTAYDPSLGIRISVNLGLFINCIKGNGTEAQFRYWCLEKEAKFMKQLWGCFGMTELGHGSNAAGVETTAVFDEASDEFIINTPHIGATKWWIGGAAHSATHSAVYARLIIKGKDYGVKTFVVPLRDSRHQLMPGVAIGDIGQKMGREGVDNGWIQFSSVRIPRFFMLQKFCQVGRDGSVTLPPLEQLSYISLLQGRVGMASDSYRICARFITVATRYAVGRRQFKGDHTGKSEETQLINYPLHQRRLMPYLALTYAAGVGTDRLERQHERVVRQLEQAVENNDDAAIRRSLADTKSLFIDSAALKSTLTWLAELCITEARQACGGLGYLAYSGFGKAYADWVVQCTWEGDNNVLGMSAGRSILKNVSDVLRKDARISGSLEFLTRAKLCLGSERVLSTESDLSPAQVLKALEVLIVRVSESALQKAEQKNSWDVVSYERVLLSKLSCHHYLLETFIGTIGEVQAPGLLYALAKVIRLYFLTHLLENFGREFISFLVLSPDLSKSITSKLIPESCLEVRDQAIPLTDSFQIPDTLLNLAIGVYDGNWYENYFRVVKTLNDPSETKAAYSSDLEAMLNRDSVADRQRSEKSKDAERKLSR